VASDPAGAWDSEFHAPALIDEVTTALAGVDAVDRDPDAVTAALARLATAVADGRFRAFVGNFAHLDRLPELAGAHYDAVLLDLGVSSHQLDDAARGFTFRRGAPLDMRMGASSAEPGAVDAARAGPDAAALLNEAPAEQLATVFRDHGDEPRAARLARAIVHRRSIHPFATSDDLVAAIRGALGPRTGPSDFARLFQAIRIAVNGEAAALELALPELRDRLHPAGRFAIIAYHSGEDRTVKHAFRDWSQHCRCPPRQPQCTCGGQALGHLVTRRAVVAGSAEIARNPRVRSARLRVWERAA
jgi:16S rRNA (cytosine1402-N4)-methyltransferase